MLTINEEGHDHYFAPYSSILMSVLPSSRTDIKMRKYGPKILAFNTTILILRNRGSNYVLLKLNSHQENKSLLMPVKNL